MLLLSFSPSPAGEPRKSRAHTRTGACTESQTRTQKDSYAHAYAHAHVLMRTVAVHGASTHVSRACPRPLSSGPEGLAQDRPSHSWRSRRPEHRKSHARTHPLTRPLDRGNSVACAHTVTHGTRTYTRTQTKTRHPRAHARAHARTYVPRDAVSCARSLPRSLLPGPRGLAPDIRGDHGAAARSSPRSRRLLRSIFELFVLLGLGASSSAWSSSAREPKPRRIPREISVALGHLPASSAPNGHPFQDR